MVASLTNLPKGILARDFAVRELKEVDPPYLKVLSGERGARECPFRDSEMATHPVLILPVVHIRNPSKALGQAGAYVSFADVPISSRTRTARHIEDALVGEVVHDAIEIVAIKRLKKPPQQCDGHVLGH
jgi:hypothetical protein